MRKQNISRKGETVEDNFDKLSIVVRETLLLKLAYKSDNPAFFVAFIIRENCDKQPKESRGILPLKVENR
jgi:hypothetical protein